MDEERPRGACRVKLHDGKTYWSVKHYRDGYSALYRKDPKNNTGPWWDLVQWSGAQRSVLFPTTVDAEVFDNYFFAWAYFRKGLKDEEQT